MCVLQGGIVVMAEIWCRLCVNMIRGRVIICSELGKGATSEEGNYLFRVTNVWWWMCAQYFVIVTCG